MPKTRSSSSNVKPPATPDPAVSSVRSNITVKNETIIQEANNGNRNKRTNPSSNKSNTTKTTHSRPAKRSKTKVEKKKLASIAGGGVGDGKKWYSGNKMDREDGIGFVRSQMACALALVAEEDRRNHQQMNKFYDSHSQLIQSQGKLMDMVAQNKGNREHVDKLLDSHIRLIDDHHGKLLAMIAQQGTNDHRVFAERMVDKAVAFVREEELS